MKCPICGAPAAPEYRPFCSRGHRDRDLLMWFDEGYRLPGRPVSDEDAEGLDSPGERD
ncbi:DNA gyrase inhibitor YacG [Sphingomonas lenta]|uniref:DNA gyrase inhibitor YacG n=1 Tax=Sphingomonas lenta TaxID=1141887 RepID=A0A2A2SEY8_9SPHN|nr:DNA gyrase inhibitor YacG [Sphingomonas lenta]